jgi:type III secretion protein V
LTQSTLFSRFTLPSVSSMEKRGAVVLILLIVAIIALMVLPVPFFILDLLIAINIAVSISLLMLAIYVPSASGLSTFPSLLMFTTLLRLALNIASTKQILLHANAGHIIETFGQLVVGGNPLVGGVVFVVIAVVQFIVIAKGAERVAEVGARFTLDGMPGKQMSIDADLRGGMINADDARRRRSALEEESQWHGAMDGAMKFVKGDAIAALIIAFVNIVAGIGVGAGMKGMTVAEAVNRYTLLTVGDGMVSQIPSLFVSVAAGILITRVSGTLDKKSNLGSQIVAQVLSHPTSLAMTALVVAAFVAVPGFPKIQFACLGIGIGVLSHLAFKVERAVVSHEKTPMPSMRGDAEREPPNFLEAAPTRAAVPLLIKISSNARNRLRAQEFADALTTTRHQVYNQLGLPFPGIRLRYDDTLEAGEYTILAQDIPKAQGSVCYGALRFDGQHPQLAALLVGGEQTAVAFAALAEGVWISETKRPTKVEFPFPLTPEEVLSRHALEVIRRNADMFLGIQEVQRMIEEAAKVMPDLAQEVTRAVPLQRIADVMRRLVQEGISIRNTREIFESLVTWAPKEKDVVMLTEYVRVDIGAVTVSRLASGRSEISVIAFSPESEDTIRAAIQTTIGGSFLALGLDKMDTLMSQIASALSQSSQQEIVPIIACSMDIRRYVKKAIESAHSGLTVLSYQELGNNVNVVSVGQINL